MLERINLVPQLPLAERIRKITLPAVGLLLALIFLFLAASDRVLKSQISSLTKDIAAAQQRATEITATQAKIAQLTSSIKQQKDEKEQLSAQAAKLTGIQERKKYFSRVLAAITTAMPSSVRCDKITFAKDGGQIAGSALQYRELPAFVKTLGNNHLFASVMLHNLDRCPDAKKADFTFTITFQLKREGDPS
ncbi:MAG: PilN domain-containing protein [Deltaproteobacteria bacterium]|nr:PilN domain-containing protein [Deltaproteobacteria bacterium]